MPDSAIPSTVFSAEFRAAFPLDDLLRGLLETSHSGIVLYSPIRAANGSIADFAIDFLNPEAQRMLQQPAQPGGTLLQHYPHTLETGAFDFHRDTFESGQPALLKVNYQGDGLDNYFHLSARRVGQGLLVSFTDTADHNRSPVEEALRASQVRERAALLAAEQERKRMHRFFMQAPVAVCIHSGPKHTYELVNPAYQEIVGDRNLLGRAMSEAMPELAGQSIFETLDHVYLTGETIHVNEIPIRFDVSGNGAGKGGVRYYNLVYQARRNEPGQIDGVFVLAVNVTELVEARQRVERSEQQAATANEELAAANEELQAANEEIQATNDDLFNTQLTLRELNQELEARVAERTAQMQRAQHEAERQRARLERFFRQAPAAICVLDGPELVFELVNPAYQALFPGRRLAGRRLLDGLPELANHEVYRTLQRVYETGSTHQEHAMLIPMARPADGQLEQRYFNYIQQPRFDENGGIDGVLVFAFEVTEQVLARQRSDAYQAEALQSAEQLVRQRETLYQVFEQTPASVAILRGPEHRFEYVNPGYQALFPGRELLGHALAEALPETVEFGFLALLDQVYKSGEPFFGTELPLQMRDASGQLMPEVYYTFTYQAYQEAGATVGVSIFAFDVTEQVHTRQQAAALQEEVSQRDAQLQTLFEQAPVAIAVIRGPEFMVELANPGMCNIWGHSYEEIVGKPLLTAMPELQGQGFDGLLESVMATGVAYVAQEQSARLQRRGQPQDVVVNYVYQPLRSAEGRITGVTVVATDVTEQVTARQLLANANEKLLAANQAVGARNQELDATNQQLTRTNQDLDNFVYAASHDLKQPVNNLAGLFEELRYSTVFTDAEEQRLLVPMVEDALRQLSTTINDLAALGQVQQPPNLPAETVDLYELTQEVLQTLQPQVQGARARVTADFAARPTVTYARANLRTILLNLLSNALKYADPARPARVHLSLWVKENRPVLLVEDNGLGFDVQRHKGELFHLFRRFHDHTEGTGVGLYLVNRIVQSNGGRLEVESEVGEGTTFRVYL